MHTPILQTALTFQRRPNISEHVVSLSHAAPSPRPEGKKNDRSRIESMGRQRMSAGFPSQAGSSERPTLQQVHLLHSSPFQLPAPSSTPIHHPPSALPTQPAPVLDRSPDPQTQFLLPLSVDPCSDHTSTPFPYLVGRIRQVGS